MLRVRQTPNPETEPFRVGTGSISGHPLERAGLVT
jgi:hypothetical protein